MEGSEKLTECTVKIKAVPSVIKIVTKEKGTVNLYQYIYQNPGQVKFAPKYQPGFTMLASTYESLATSVFKIHKIILKWHNLTKKFTGIIIYAFTALSTAKSQDVN